MKIALAESKNELEKCFPVMVQLRSTLNEEDFIERVTAQQESGYKLAFVEDNGNVVALAGFRISESLSWGKYLYVDDLITDSENRSKGYGDKLFDWLIDFAKKENCNQFHLDSGVQRFEAHRFYLRKRMNIFAHHFQITLKD
jgi:GNAT superfamily N-acetyltransferase